MSTLQAILYERGSLALLDQRRLPHESTTISVNDPESGWHAIKEMAVRGAPAIAVSAALCLAADLAKKGSGKQFAGPQEASAFIIDQLKYLVTSRPTAVNLQDAVGKLTALVRTAASEPASSSSSVVEAYIKAAEEMIKTDIAANKSIGQHGAEAVMEAIRTAGAGPSKARVLTICNTGSLATAGYGTALGVIRSLHTSSRLEHAFFCETRPFNQGSRLTAYEMAHDKIPSTLICDSAAAALVASGRVDAVVVGADRVTANGDTANKIGTLMLATIAAHYRTPFFVAAPTTTLDPSLPDGSHIKIEERPSEEVTHWRGQPIAPASTNVWNPAFDVTPSSMITGIITERGVIHQEQGRIDVRGFMVAQGLLPALENGHTGSRIVSPIPGFKALDVDSVMTYLEAKPDLAKLLGPRSSPDSWKAREVGDGNLNFVYIVEGPEGGLVVKQALPFLRLVGDDWPLGQQRIGFEAAALETENRYCPEHTPTLHLYDPRMALIVMQYLAPPHVILRLGLTEGHIYPQLADQVSLFLAQTLFHTSLIHLNSEQFREQQAKFLGNIELIRLTEQVIFSEPYFDASNNWHTTPHLDDLAQLFQTDVNLKAAISGLKAKFMERGQAMLQGDFHTGSLMVTEESMFAIDAEFAFYGPMAFDVGKIIANLLIAFFASDGHEARLGSSRQKQRTWLLQAVVEVWEKFQSRFLELWNSKGSGDLYPQAIYASAGSAALKTVQQQFMKELLEDSLGMAGAVMIRRIIGIAHVQDFKHIDSDDQRAPCERRALQLAQTLLLGAQGKTIQSVASDAEGLRDNVKAV